MEVAEGDGGAVRGARRERTRKRGDEMSDAREQAGRVVCNALVAKAREQGNALPEGWEDTIWGDPLRREQCISAAMELARWFLAQHVEVEEVEEVREGVEDIETRKMEVVG